MKTAKEEQREILFFKEQRKPTHPCRLFCVGGSGRTKERGNGGTEERDALFWKKARKKLYIERGGGSVGRGLAPAAIDCRPKENALRGYTSSASLRSAPSPQGEGYHAVTFGATCALPPYTRLLSPAPARLCKLLCGSPHFSAPQKPSKNLLFVTLHKKRGNFL